MKTKLLLIRHAQSVTNSDKIFTGQLNAGLSELGIRQAELMAEWVNSHFKLNAVYSSDLSRAIATAAPLARIAGLEVHPETKLREILAPHWEGLHYSEIYERWPHQCDVFFLDPGHFNPLEDPTLVGTESCTDLASRIEDKLRTICANNPGLCVAVISHGTPIRAMQSLWETGSLENMKDTPWAGNASVTIVEYDGTAFHIVDASVDTYLGHLGTTIKR